MSCSVCDTVGKIVMLDDLKSWAQKPFSADMDALHWFLFFGLLIAISVLWGLILASLRRASA